jgi:conjugative transfer signal peptidase TraF
MRCHRTMRRTTWRDLAALGCVFLGLAVATVVWHRSGLILNHTGSMPVGFYRLRPAPGRPGGQLARGATVVWCLPTPLVVEARRRRYLVRGQCPGGVEPILKMVAALPGDTVVVDAIGLTVNGRRLPNSHPVAFDSHGRRLSAVPRGVHVVPPGYAWLWSPHTALSFDSRYYGAVPISGLVGLARPVWVRATRVTSAGASGHLPLAAPVRQ